MEYRSSNDTKVRRIKRVNHRLLLVCELNAYRLCRRVFAGMVFEKLGKVLLVSKLSCALLKFTFSGDSRRPCGVSGTLMHSLFTCV